ncbi:radical SAM/SPASM domain-containing protein [Sulfurimonas sp. HSL-1716]|uniref:radical SAM/SPASM domain-containing protein n=1 Tax=Hydrocurvibacter sulfurireducens TaxID=3131937 RepID=UPI0031F73972
MYFHRVHIEVTNICGLSCSFCTPKKQPPKTMSIAFFEKVLTELKPYTRTLAFHILGDPLTLSNLALYLESAYLQGFEVELTTSGYYLKKTPFSTLFHPAVRQINISLNSYNKNSLNMGFEEYMQSVMKICKEKLKNHPKPFINLRIWNLDEHFSELSFNKKIFDYLRQHFDIEVDETKIYEEKIRSIRIDSKIVLRFDNYFEWPSLTSSHQSHGSCYGLKSHIGILADGTVVPCCLDGEGVINLGNIGEIPLKEILKANRAQTMIKGFAQMKAVEELCVKCSYKNRFQNFL